MSIILKIHENRTCITGTLHECHCTFMIWSRPVVLRIKMFQSKFPEEFKTYFMFNNFPPPPENHTFSELTWKSIVEPDRPQMTIWRMRIPFWIPNATSTHWEYTISIAFPLRQWLYERASALRYTCSACLSLYCHATIETFVCYSLLTAVHVLGYQPSCHNCLYLAIVFKFVTFKVLLQGSKHDNRWATDLPIRITIIVCFFLATKLHNTNLIMWSSVSYTF